MTQKKNQTKPKTKILFATSNPGKLTEASIFAKSAGVNLVSVKDIGLELDVDETGDTYEENSLLKVMAYADQLMEPDLIIIADDGGIEIPVLGNAPGVHSRRWKGYPMTDQEIIDHCLEQLDGKKGGERDAQFISVVTVKIPGHPVKYFRVRVFLSDR
ncbi:MAG: non-canonical purine NTP pyrophosphatase [Candidatus Saccharibacteria bacterium]|nr:non-canonical purine NTP pyrophosphatase [Candidatus Saccharibacteria bacterium]